MKTDREILTELVGRVQELLSHALPQSSAWHQAIQRAMCDLYDELSTYEWLRERKHEKAS